MKYKLNVKIEPEKNYIHVQGQVEGVNCDNLAQIFLNENYNVISLDSQDENLNYVFDKNGDRPPFDHVSRPVNINSKIENLFFEYDGEFKTVIARVNQINEGVVELACYSGWYPKIFDLSFKFDFEITLELPKGYFVITNGDTTLLSSTNSYSRYCLKSVCKVSDILIFASNKLNQINSTSERLELNVYCTDKMKNIALSKVKHIAAGYEILIKLFGDSPLINTKMNYIYRPGGGWGYGREFVTIMPEQENKNEVLSRFDSAHIVHLDLHELAHIWWGSASTTHYDWINEGGAEFSSLTLIKEMFGEDVFLKYVEYYVAKINDEVNEKSILETGSDSPDRELNHYIKTTLMYIGAEKRFGNQQLFDFLKKYCHRYLGTQNADTTNFLETCEEHIGKEARDYFQYLLTLKSWKGVDIKRDILHLI